TAAVMKSLDLVITSDTAIPHLAGGLGVPVWVALNTGSCWRWLLEREDSPWYPTMRLFRQTRLGDWNAVFERIAVELRKKVEAAAPAKPILIEVPACELIDKITILQIKRARITDADKLANVNQEFDALMAARRQRVSESPELDHLTTDLRRVNATLWDIEDEIRECERFCSFGSRFVELARSVYQQNDRRAAIKRQINKLLGSRLQEEKAYKPYGVPVPACPAGRKRVSLTMIVRNEESNLPECLTTAADLVDEGIIADTGSTDRTREIASRFGARVVDSPWADNFGAARNASLQAATGDWIWWLDADDRLDSANRDRARTLFARLGNEKDAYAMKVRSRLNAAGTAARLLDQVRLFPNHPDIRWHYRVHEQIMPAVRSQGGDLRWADVTIEHTGYQDRAMRRGKLERNFRLLQLDHAERPEDPYT